MYLNEPVVYYTAAFFGMLSIRTQFLKCLVKPIEDSKMELTDQVVIKATSFDDAKNKLNKFVKRGAVDICQWEDSTLLDWVGRYGCVYVTVYEGGRATIQNHDCQPAAVLKRVRDVENYRV